ncbi:MAG: pyridoxal-dependent aspartate 1-decarboxylase PanP [Thermodesulfobacteriota bacterium]
MDPRKEERQDDRKDQGRELVANRETLKRIFIMRESDSSRATILKYMEQILFGLHEFLQSHVGITEEVSLPELARRFTDSAISKEPEKKLAAVITELIDDIAPYAVNVSSPYFVGHMTSAIPFFMVHLSTIVAALNQNVVKLETSKVVSMVEKQVLAKLHRVVYRMDEEFYQRHVQSPFTSLGGFVEGGTQANLTALWVARNRAFGPKNGFAGVEAEGMPAALKAHGVERGVVLVSQLGHYSLRKAGGVLGIGNRNVLSVSMDKNFRINLRELESTIDELWRERAKTRIVAVIGIAGTTETGTVDPLSDLADMCAEYGIHFHVDAAWGGPTLFSENNGHMLKGIERADSVTIDGHKQFYMPMTCGMVYFKDPKAMDAVAYHAAYVNRVGSVDLGIRSLAGSRASTSLILASALKIMGQRGYALMIDHGIETAREFAAEIESRKNFQLITRPQLNILTYRYCPAHIKKRFESATPAERLRINQFLNRANIALQRRQREAGKSFVSRTTLRLGDEMGGNTVVLRSVIMNPMTHIGILREVLDEQEHIATTKLSANFAVDWTTG